MKIFLMRHGIIENPNRVVYARLPGFNLSKEGKSQVNEVAGRLKDENIEVIYASPLNRTRETAEIVAQVLNLSSDKIIIEEDLIDSEVTEWEGKPADNFFAMLNYRKFVEPEEEQEARMFKVFQKGLLAKKSFLIVSHADPIMALLNLVDKKFNLGQYEYIRKAEIIVMDYQNNQLKYLETIKPSFQINRQRY